MSGRPEATTKQEPRASCVALGSSGRPFSCLGELCHQRPSVGVSESAWARAAPRTELQRAESTLRRKARTRRIAGCCLDWRGSPPTRHDRPRRAGARREEVMALLFRDVNVAAVADDVPYSSRRAGEPWSASPQMIPSPGRTCRTDGLSWHREAPWKS
jgi:hypothetical protein